MNTFKSLSLAAAVAAIGFTAAAPQAQARVELGVEIGAAPVCPYGYYDYAPYPCAPYGYYGPEWFTGGVFIGAGPWFHGDDGFRGRVNHDFEHFSGTEMRDGRGHGFEMGGHEGGGRR